MSDIMPSLEELMRQHALAALRDERDTALEENKRLRALYENVTRNQEQFGWTINHLLECEEALRVVEAHAAERDALAARVEELEARIARAVGIVQRARVTMIHGGCNIPDYEPPVSVAFPGDDWLDLRRILRGEDDTSTERTE